MSTIELTGLAAAWGTLIFILGLRAWPATARLANPSVTVAPELEPATAATETPYHQAA